MAVESGESARGPGRGSGDGCFAVRLPTGRTVREDDDREYARALKEAYGQGPAVCLCKSLPNQRKLKICRGERADDVRYWVARYSGTGEEHTDGCRHGALHPLRTGAREYEPGVISERDDDGMVALRFRLPLSTRKSAVAPEPSSSGRGSDDAAREDLRSASPLGLLHLLWERARLNVWEPQFGKGRFSGILRGRLAGAVDRIILNRTELAAMFGSLFIPQPSGARDALHMVLGGAQAARRRVILVGELVFSDAGEPYLVGGTQAYGVSLKLDAKRMRERFPRVAPIVANEGRAVALVVAEVTGNHTRQGNHVLAVVDSVCMGVERMTWTPVDSTYELTIARKLYDEQRSFRKPLRFDAGRDVALPDFELRDVGERPVPLEVFGRDDVAYRDRAAQKHALYDELYGPLWWAWDATTSTDPPAFPGAR